MFVAPMLPHEIDRLPDAGRVYSTIEAAVAEEAARLRDTIADTDLRAAEWEGMFQDVLRALRDLATDRKTKRRADRVLKRYAEEVADLDPDYTNVVTLVTRRRAS